MTSCPRFILPMGSAPDTAQISSLADTIRLLGALGHDRYIRRLASCAGLMFSAAWLLRRPVGSERLAQVTNRPRPQPVIHKVTSSKRNRVEERSTMRVGQEQHHFTDECLAALDH